MCNTISLTDKESAAVVALLALPTRNMLHAIRDALATDENLSKFWTCDTAVEAVQDLASDVAEDEGWEVDPGVPLHERYLGKVFARVAVAA